MSRKIAYVASMMKRAESLRDRLLEELLSKSKLESWDFSGEDIEQGWQIVDALMAINSEVSVQAAVNRAIERMEYAEQVLDRREEMEMLGMPYDDMTATRSLEEF